MKAATYATIVYPESAPISIHAAREGGDIDEIQTEFNSLISIHAAREGGDPQPQPPLPQKQGISIHAAREGGDYLFSGFSWFNRISIHAAREGGDEDISFKLIGIFYFNPRRP